MRSSGGICDARLVAQNLIQTILSGPAGGVAAMETLARDRLVSATPAGLKFFHMTGTAMATELRDWLTQTSSLTSGISTTRASSLSSWFR